MFCLQNDAGAAEARYKSSVGNGEQPPHPTLLYTGEGSSKAR